MELPSVAPRGFSNATVSWPRAFRKYLQTHRDDCKNNRARWNGVHRALFVNFVLTPDQSGFLVVSGLAGLGFESAVIGGRLFSLP